MLGDIVFAEVPEAGKSVEKEGQAAVVESTKAASDVYSPISGEITEGNKAIVDDPSSINADPEGASWFRREGVAAAAASTATSPLVKRFEVKASISLDHVRVVAHS